MLRLSALAAAVSLVAAALFLALGRYAPRETVPGMLVAERGIEKVFPTRAGRIDIVHVKEGDRVHRGQPLALVAVEQGLMNSRGESAVEQILAALHEEIARMQDASRHEQAAGKSARNRLTSRIDALRDEVRAIEAEKATLAREVEHGESIMRRIAQLHRRGYVTELEYTSRQQQLLALKRQDHALDKALALTRGQLNDARLELQQQPAQAAQKHTDLQNRISELRRRIASHEVDRGYAVTAPIAGTVRNLIAESGRLANPAEPLLVIVADDVPLVAHLLVPSRAVGFVASGQPAHLRYHAFPHEQYDVQMASIRDVGTTALRPEEVAVGVALSEPVYRVVAAPEQQSVLARGRRHALRAGMLLEADIVLEERPLWAWLLRPLLAVRGRL